MTRWIFSELFHTQRAHYDSWDRLSPSMDITTKDANLKYHLTQWIIFSIFSHDTLLLLKTALVHFLHFHLQRVVVMFCIFWAHYWWIVSGHVPWPKYSSSISSEGSCFIDIEIRILKSIHDLAELCIFFIETSLPTHYRHNVTDWGIYVKLFQLSPVVMQEWTVFTADQ